MGVIQARHISGGAASGIGFGVALFILVSISLGMWYRRVHRDLYSNDPNVWGGSWGQQAQRELQECINKARAEEWARGEEQRQREAAEQDVREHIDLEEQRSRSVTKDALDKETAVHGSTPAHNMIITDSTSKGAVSTTTA